MCHSCAELDWYPISTSQSHAHITPLLYHQSDPFAWPIAFLSQYCISCAVWVRSNISAQTLPPQGQTLVVYNAESDVFATCMLPILPPVKECAKYRGWVFWIIKAPGHYFEWCSNMVTLSLSLYSTKRHYHQSNHQTLKYHQYPQVPPAGLLTHG